jgi:hypothetical protein
VPVTRSQCTFAIGISTGVLETFELNPSRAVSTSAGNMQSLAMVAEAMGSYFPPPMRTVKIPADM